MGKKVAVVTDSTAYLPDDLTEKYQISVVPQVLIWEGKTYLDGVDIQPAEFYQRLSTAKEMPSTSQASPASMISIFKDLHEKEYEILAVLISSKLSGTISSGEQAREALPEVRVKIVDSQTTAMAMGFMAIEAAKAAADGASLEDCAAVAEQCRPLTGVVFAVDTLEFLHRGGRIGGAARFIGTALNFKPILEVQQGAIEAAGRVRTRKKSLQRLVELVEERIGGRTPLHLATLHANAREEAHALLDQAAQQMNADESVFSEVSPVVGTHTGPGTIGLAFMAGK